LKSGWTELHRRTLLRFLRIRVAPFLCLALHTASLAAQEPPAVPSPNIRVEVDRVNVGVIVTDSKGNFVEDLQQGNFQVLDSGTPQLITDFAPINAPAQVLMLLEVGPAVYMLQDSHLYVAQALLNGLSTGDRVAIAVYNDAPTALLNYTTDKGSVTAALNQIQFNLGYGNLNLATSLNTVLDWLARVPGKKSVVLLSSGVDTSPTQDMQSLLPRLETGDVRIFSISMSGPLRNGKKGTKQEIQQTQQAFAQADAWLQAMSEASGGRAYFPESAKAFQETYTQVAQLLRHEYSLAFAPPKADGVVHAIDVKVLNNEGSATTPDYRVDHRRGYIAPRPSAQ